MLNNTQGATLLTYKRYRHLEYCDCTVGGNVML